ncbi:hypothetical protein AGMMS49992_16840 [Clostridia bacterium]|nr:hypothetical protein AGMMS49992_16840 [Clostridia bacterium]
MRLQLKDMRTVWLRDRAETVNVDNDDGLYKWQDGAQGINVKLTPLNIVNNFKQFSDSREYGEVSVETVNMYYPGRLRLQYGQGVCVHVGQGNSCDYRIFNVENWPGYQKAGLEYIAENMRG